MTARQLAYRLLMDEKAFASDALHHALSDFDAREAGLAWELVMGVLRYRAQLDFLIAHFSGKPIKKMDLEVVVAMRMAIYQIRYLERIPKHAAVSESVELVKQARKRSAVGFVNAVLRKVDQNPVTWPSREVEFSCPEWILARWEAHFGVENVQKVVKNTLKTPEKHVRGERFQDVGAQSIVPLLGLEPGQSFLDVCAAPGNKTLQALESRVNAIACDRHWSRLRKMEDVGCPKVVLDATQPLPFKRLFDRILVDAPCSGTGTLSRNPEIKWKLTPGDLPQLQQRQRLIVRNALACLAPGGRLVYSTCSLEPEENEQVVEDLPVTNIYRRLPGIDPGDGFFAAVIPSG